MISDTALAALAAEAKYQATQGASMFVPVVTVQLLIEEISLGRAAATVGASPKITEARVGAGLKEWEEWAKANAIWTEKGGGEP